MTEELTKTSKKRKKKIVYKDWTIIISRRSRRAFSRRKYINFYVSLDPADGLAGYEMQGSFSSVDLAESEAKKHVDYLIRQDELYAEYDEED